jgi:hypothetical protein
MPYKDPEHKRQWEREHREQRNRSRRMQRLDARSGWPGVSKTPFDMAATLGTRVGKQPDPGSDQKSKSGWKAVLGWAVGIGVLVLGVFAGLSHPASGTQGSGN